jgi:hypothetical protein
MKYSGLIRAVSSAATGNHINRGRFSFAGAHHPIRSSRMINPDLQEDPRTRWLSTHGLGEIPYPYTVKYANLNKYVAVALSVPNLF